MGGPALAEGFRFEGFQFDRAGGYLLRENGLGEAEPLPLGSRATALLALLLERQGKLVTKDEIFASVWPGMAVEEANLTMQISALRRVLDQGRDRGSCIQTIAGRGYRFVAPVSRAAPSAPVIENPLPPALALPDKPSIAVLPFANLSGDTEQEYFSDGMVEEIITALSRTRSFFVIARQSSFTYKGKTVDVKQVGRELGVRYLLEGSVRKAGQRVRIAARLIDAVNGAHIWAERFDGALDDIFELQDEITEAVTIAVAPAIADAELHRAMRKLPGNLDAWAAYQRGLWHMGRASAEDYELAESFFQQAVALDPTFGGGYRGLAFVRFQEAAVFQTRGLHEAQSSAEALARHAIALDGADAELHSSLGQALWARGELEGMAAEAEQALALSPNLALAHGVLGAALLFSGRPKEGLAALQTCNRLNPRDYATLPLRLNQIALGLYFCREYEAAVQAAKKGIRSYPNFPLTYRWLAAALGELGRIEEAKETLKAAIAIAPASFDMYVRNRVSWMRPEDHAHMLEGLRKAGWKG
jgi:adenylate cyclase